MDWTISILKMTICLEYPWNGSKIRVISSFADFTKSSIKGTSCRVCRKVLEAIARKQGRALVKCWKPVEVVVKLSLVVITEKTWRLESLRDSLPIGCVNDLEMEIQYQKRKIPIIRPPHLAARIYAIISDAHIALARAWPDRCDTNHWRCSRNIWQTIPPSVRWHQASVRWSISPSHWRKSLFPWLPDA